MRGQILEVAADRSCKRQGCSHAEGSHIEVPVSAHRGTVTDVQWHGVQVDVSWSEQPSGPPRRHDVVDGKTSVACNVDQVYSIRIDVGRQWDPVALVRCPHAEMSRDTAWEELTDCAKGREVLNDGL